ncbi:MAG: c-type cytochrome [Azovibrio sp.]|nr:c-type cytochrome [Azovibrio sp.]
MSRFSKSLLALALAGLAGSVSAFDNYKGLGRPATEAEIKAWDIDVRPDFKGLPKGAGSVDLGAEVFEARCASCHGSFGESNEVFTPLVGGTTQDDIKTGRVQSLRDGSAPQRTTLMKVATISTLFDYINRAMPWTEPKSLKPNEVYGILAYLLHLAEIVPADFELSDRNIAEVQKRMPNRNGMTTDHGMWPGKGLGNGGKPDVKNVACMRHCKKEVQLVSSLPDYAADAHGNLAEQNREVGQARGKVTGAKSEAKAAEPLSESARLSQLANTSGCMACHGVNGKIVGPGFNEVMAKYKGQAEAETQLAHKVKAGGAGVWGSVPMPPHPQLSDADAAALVKWILSGAPAK